MKKIISLLQFSLGSGILVFGTSFVQAKSCPDLTGVYKAEMKACSRMSALLPIHTEDSQKLPNIDFYNLYGGGSVFPFSIRQMGCEVLEITTSVGPYTPSKKIILDIDATTESAESFLISSENNNGVVHLTNIWKLKQLDSGDIELRQELIEDSAEKTTKSIDNFLFKKIK